MKGCWNDFFQLMNAKKFRKTSWWIGCLLLGVLVLAPPVCADIYWYMDEKGVVHFTNTPTASDRKAYRVFIRETPASSKVSRSTDEFDRLITHASRLNGVEIPLLKAIIKAESDFNPKAVSRKGALGLMQIMPENLQKLDIEDPFDPRENILGGARYFRELFDRYEGKLALSLAAYNAGPTAVDRYNSIPPYPETEDYVRRVLKYYYDFKY
jgi:soluble lytic murein transglycosylase-like protein